MSDAASLVSVCVIPMKSKYIHKEAVHNLSAPQEIVPEIMKLLQPRSVVDIGCGLGTFLYCFKEAGVNSVLGVDGPWTDKSLLSKFLSTDEFIEMDLEKKINLNRRFDLVVSLEVAEHLSPESADIFVENLVSAGDVILFSAAIPFQGGQNHLNEQWLTYWEKKFNKHGYIIHDFLRPIFWNNPNIFWWYKQNMVFITTREFSFKTVPAYNLLLNVVHYESFEAKAKRLDKILSGKLFFIHYLRLMFLSLFRYEYVKKLKNFFGPK